MFLKFWWLLVLKPTCFCNMLNQQLLAMLEDRPNFEYIINLTTVLGEVLEVENFIVYSNRNHILAENTLEQTLAEYFQMPTIVWGRCYTTRHRNIIGPNGLAFAQFTGLEDPLLNAVEQTLRDLHSMPIIFILERTSDFIFSTLEMQRFFLWCWKNYLLNVLLVVENTTQVYKYTPFPEIIIQNATTLSLHEQIGFMTTEILRVHGFQFVTPMFNMPPYSFMVPAKPGCEMAKNCTQTISGIGGRFFSEYIRQINGTIDFVMHQASFYEVHNIMADMIKNRSIHIGLFPTSDLYVETTIPYGSHPIWHVNACIMVPYMPEIFYGDYVKRTFGSSVWLLVIVLAAALIILQAINIMFTGLRKTQELQRNLTYKDPLTYAIAHLAIQPISQNDLRAHGQPYRILQLLILLMCFVLINMYTTTLTSLLNTTLFDRQINTLTEFLDSNLTLLISEEQKKTLLDNGRLPAALMAKVKASDFKTLARNRRTMNISNAYVTSSNLWDYIDLQQKRLAKPVFRLAGKELCTREFFVKFPLRRDSPFKSSLTLFTLSAHETGLTNKWNDMNAEEGVQMEHIHMFQNEVTLWKPLQLAHYAWVLWIALLLWSVAFICFLCEIFYYRWQSKQQLFEFVH